MRVLLIDDDAELHRLLAAYLAGHGVELLHAGDGARGNALLEQGGIDAVVLDVMLPGEDGLTICRRLRAAGYTVPIVMLTARGDDEDRIAGLEIGADDYLPKPCNPRELLARLRAVVRRAAPTPRDRIVVDDLEIDLGAQRVSVGGTAIELTSFELRLLAALARRAGQAVARADLAAELKGGAYDPSVERSLDVHVSHLRQKLERDPREPKRIRTVRGVGYLLARAGG